MVGYKGSGNEKYSGFHKPEKIVREYHVNSHRARPFFLLVIAAKLVLTLVQNYKEKRKAEIVDGKISGTREDAMLYIFLLLSLLERGFIWSLSQVRAVLS